MFDFLHSWVVNKYQVMKYTYKQCFMCFVNKDKMRDEIMCSQSQIYEY